MLILTFSLGTMCFAQNHKTFYPDGKTLKESGNKIKDKNEGLWKTYRSGGQLWHEGMYKNGLKTGIWKTYFPNGNIVVEQPYVNGVRMGTQKQYHESNGKLKFEMTFSGDNGRLL